MTDYQLPVLRHLTADEVVPGMTIAEALAQYQALAGQATTGPWTTDRTGWLVAPSVHSDYYSVADVDRATDSRFIAASRALGPAMAAALQEILEINEPICTRFTKGDHVESFVKGYSRALQDIHYLIFNHLEGK